MITPEMLARSGSEDANQKALILWASLNENKWPKLKWLYHCPNGGSRNIIEGAKLKLMGVRRGVPDLHLPCRSKGYIGLWIELKIDSGKLSIEQSEWLYYLGTQGYACYVCYGWENAKERIMEYLNAK